MRNDFAPMVTDRRQSALLSMPRPGLRRPVVGVDGGGTKTHAVILDSNFALVGEGFAGPSNPLRVGIANAAAAVREAIEKACEAAQVRRTDLVAAEIGLAGASRPELRARMREALHTSGIGEIIVVSDADIALYGVTEGEPGVIVIAGTGSICCGTIRAANAFALEVGGRLPATKVAVRGLRGGRFGPSHMRLTAVARQHR